MITSTTIALSQNYVSYFNKGNNYYAEYQKIKQDANLNSDDHGNLNSDDLLQMDKLLDKAEYNYKKAKSMMDYGDPNIYRVKKNLKIISLAKGYVGVNKKSFKKIFEREAYTPPERESKSYYNNGQLKSIGKYTHTIFDKTEFKTGEWKYYHENGQLDEIVKYENGKRIGECKVYYENGQLKAIGKYENENRTGEWKAYHENGQLKVIGKFKNGKRIGEWKIYDENGKLIKTENLLTK